MPKTAFQIALDHVGKDTNIHQEAARKRCLARLEKKRQLEEEARKRKEEAELLDARQRELDEEKRVSCHCCCCCRLLGLCDAPSIGTSRSF